MRKMSKERAQEIRGSDLWEKVCEELDYRIDCSLNKLRNCPPEEVVGHQIHIKILEEFKRLPDDVVDREEDAGSGPSR